MKVCIITLLVLAMVGCDAKQGRGRLSDAVFSQKLIGVWSAEETNRFGVHFVSDVTYSTNGSVRWRGSLTEQSGTQRDFDDSGCWRVERGHLITKVTNSTFRPLLDEPEYRDELVSVTAAEFIYRDDHGAVHTRTKKP